MRLRSVAAPLAGAFPVPVGPQTASPPLRPAFRRPASSAAAAHKSNPDALPQFETIEQTVGRTPLVKLQRLLPPNRGSHKNVVLAKLEGNNPAGSVKDRPALSMITHAERRGVIKPGDNIIEATSGNTGIALAMAAAIKGYKLTLIMPSNMSSERRAAMLAYGASYISVPPGAMEAARDLAQQLAREGKGVVLDQFSNLDNPEAHYRTTGPELWEQTGGRITHFVASMGTTGTAMGVSRFLKEKNPDIKIYGLQPAEGATIPGIRRWGEAYMPKVFDRHRVDGIIDIEQWEAEEMMRAMARTEGIFAGTSSGGSISAALRLSHSLPDGPPAVIAAIVCDRGDRYLSTGMFDESASKDDPKPVSWKYWAGAASRLIAYPGPRFVAFLGATPPLKDAGAPESERDGQWWDRKSRLVADAARKLVREHGGTLLEVRLGSESEWKQGVLADGQLVEHPLIADPGAQLRDSAGKPLLPVLCRWEDGLLTERVAVGSDSVDAVEKAVKEFVAR
ncbi:tryptophan synthase beta subunit-like PLP-dependent enzyme [Hyaloraphidium curvatum]|nr:tryptophan synthase beta subunit-like PLP-dependent enzyme [Hyaloraphidium curvatum]